MRQRGTSEVEEDYGGESGGKRCQLKEKVFGRKGGKDGGWTVDVGEVRARMGSDPEVASCPLAVI